METWVLGTNLDLPTSRAQFFSRARNATTGTGNKKRRTLRKSRTNPTSNLHSPLFRSPHGIKFALQISAINSDSFTENKDLFSFSVLNVHIVGVNLLILQA